MSMKPTISTNGAVVALSLPAAEAEAIAGFLKRLGYEDCARIAIGNVTYDSAEEADLIWSGVLSLRRGLDEAGAPLTPSCAGRAQHPISDKGGRS